MKMIAPDGIETQFLLQNQEAAADRDARTKTHSSLLEPGRHAHMKAFNVWQKKSLYDNIGYMPTSSTGHGMSLILSPQLKQTILTAPSQT